MPSRQRRIQELNKSAKKCHNLLAMFRASTPDIDDKSDAGDVSCPASHQNTSRLGSPMPDITSCPGSPMPDNTSCPGSPMPDDARPLPVTSSFVPITTACHSPISINVIESPAASPVRIPACKRRLEDTDSTPSRKRHTSGHSLGFKSEWTVDRPWLTSKTICNPDEESYVVMLCRLCTKHQTKSSTSVWTVDGCRTLRLDKVKDHEKSVQHKTSLAKEDARSTCEAQASSVSSSTEKAVRDALKVLFYIVQNNLSLDLFSSMVDMCIDVGSPTLQHLRLAKNASYTSWDIVQELLSVLSQEVQETILADIRRSPSFGLMVDEVCDIVSNKHMAMCCQYITPDGDVTSSFLCDPFIKDGKAATIVDTIQEEITHLNLDTQKMAGFASDGAAVFTGKHNGVATQLKEICPGLVTNHCIDHRLALACRDSFKDVKIAHKVDDTLERLYKYYKFSTVHTATLLEVQKAFGEPTLCVQQAKHHRWLSHTKAVTSVVRSYKSLITDLEQNTISSDAVGNGLLKLLKDPAIVQTIFFLADVLPHLASLSLFFQRQAVNMGMVGAIVQKTLKSLEIRGKDDGPWLRKLDNILRDCGVDTPDSKDRQKFKEQVREPFISSMLENIERRFKDTEVMDNLAILDTSSSETVGSFYGVTEIEFLANHYDMEEEALVVEWTDFLNFITQRDGSRDMLACLQLFHGQNNLGLKALFPNVSSLYAKACVVPLSTAEVERVFSQVKLIKTAHRNRMNQTTLNRLLNIKLNCSAGMFESVLPAVTKKWICAKNRRLPTVIAFHGNSS